MSEMTTVACAEILGISTRQVARLARAGELTVSRTVGGALLVQWRTEMTDRFAAWDEVIALDAAA